MPARKRRVEEHVPRKRAAERRAVVAAVAATEPSTARVIVLLFSALMLIYVLNFRFLGSGDSIPPRLLPFSILREGNLNLDEFSWNRRSDGRLPYYVHQVGEHVYSVSTIATAVVITPLYILPAWWLAANNVAYDDVRARVIIVAMERISAALITAMSASLLFVVLRRLTSWRWALLLAVVYALGTSTWSISSQALWPHGLSELCLVITCYVLLQPQPSTAALVALGLTTAVMLANRPQAIVVAAPAFLFVSLYHRWRVIAFALLPALVGVLLILYNRAIFNHASGGYGSLAAFNGKIMEGLPGLLISPNRGLLIYTPIMLFALWGAIQVWRVPSPPWLRWLSVVVALHVLMYASFSEWWAGYAWGPRYFTDIVPALVIFLVYGLVPFCRRPAIRILAGALIVYGIVIQSIGVYAADDRWNRDPFPLERRPQRVWDWSDLQIVRGLEHGWRPAELASLMVDAFRDPVSAQVAPLTEDQLTSTVTVRGLPSAVRRGAKANGSAQIVNRSSVAWPAFSGEGPIGGRLLVYLLVRWMVNGQPIDGLGDVVDLPENLAPGQTVEVPLSLVAPPTAGEFELEFRVTQAVDRNHGMISRDILRVPMHVE